MKPQAEVSFLDGVERCSAALVIDVAWCARCVHKSAHICARDSLLTLVQAAVQQFQPCWSSHLRANAAGAAPGERGETQRFERAPGGCESAPVQVQVICGRAARFCCARASRRTRWGSVQMLELLLTPAAASRQHNRIKSAGFAAACKSSHSRKEPGRGPTNQNKDFSVSV